MLKPAYITLIIMWVVYALIHTGLASGIATRFAQRLMGRAAKYYRAVYSLLVLITLLILIHYHFDAIDTILFRPHWVEKIIAGILIIGGFVVIVICLWEYIMPYSGFDVIFGMERTLDLPLTGLHAYVRHPLFTGAIVFIWGVFLGYPYMNNLISAVCLTVYAFIAVYFAEKRAIGKYGDAYQQYSLKVPALVPFIPKKIFS
jgi:protein-S-isoprenylcysteine O-methyltransferase Ste14